MTTSSGATASEKSNGGTVSSPNPIPKRDILSLSVRENQLEIWTLDHLVCPRHEVSMREVETMMGGVYIAFCPVENCDIETTLYWDKDKMRKFPEQTVQNSTVPEPPNKFYGIADAHGLESFTPWTKGNGRDLYLLTMRAEANRQRHAIVYVVELTTDTVNEIHRLLALKEFKDALVAMKVRALTIGFPEQYKEEYARSWKMIPNDDLDPYEHEYETKGNSSRDTGETGSDKSNGNSSPSNTHTPPQTGNKPRLERSTPPLRNRTNMVCEAAQPVLKNYG